MNQILSALKIRIPPPFYALVIALLMWSLDRYLPLIQLSIPELHLIGWILIALGAFIDLWSLALFFSHRTTPNPLKPERSSHLVTSGMYRFSRNPMYLGLLLILLGWFFLLGSLTPFLMVPLFVVVLSHQQIIPEEQSMENNFGKEYRQYKESVRRWI